MEKRERKNRKLVKLLVWMIILGFAVLGADIAYMLYASRFERAEMRAYKELSEEAFSSQIEVVEPAAQPQELPAPVMTPTPEPLPTVAPRPVRQSRMDFSSLLRDYPDIAGWLRGQGTVIDYPVMHGIDNDFYLHHMYDGSEAVNGSIFLDCFNAGDFSDCNSILYGHHMASGAMFASICGYKNQYYYNEHPVLYLYTPTGDYTLEVMAGFIYADGVNEWYFGYDQPSDLLEYTQWAKEVSTFSSPVEAKEGDRLVTLVTCTYEYEDARYVLVTKMKEEIN